MDRHIRNFTGTLVALLSTFVLYGCNGGGSGNSMPANLPVTDTSFSDVAIATSAGLAGSDDGSGSVALYNHTLRPGWAARLRSAIALERIAYAMRPGFTCGTPLWTQVSATENDLMPPNCTIVFPGDDESQDEHGTHDNATGNIVWSNGPWQFMFPDAACPATSGLQRGAAGSSCANGSHIDRQTPAAPPAVITRSVTGPFGDMFVINIDSGSGVASGFQTPKTATSTVITCGVSTADTCPTSEDTPDGGRTVNVQGMHVVGTRNGVPNWDHTVYTSVPLTVTGAGSERVILGGTLVVEHNLRHVVTTTTFSGGQLHIPECAFPINGQVTTRIAGGPDDGKTETVTFTSVCGRAILNGPDNQRRQLRLSLVF